MRKPRDLGWEYGEPTPYPAGRRPVRRPLPHPTTARLPGGVRLTTYRLPWWQSVDWSIVAGTGISLFAMGYLLWHVLRWLHRWPL